ncbi:MAG: RidA family protein [Gammaproteobacteria bacterium]
MSIERWHKGPRMSQAVKHAGVVYLAGQVAQNAQGAPVADQTKDILARIDALLAEAGTGKSNLLSASIWLADISTFNEMNAVWDAWIDPDNPPARACVQASLAAPHFTVEIAVVAAA